MANYYDDVSGPIYRTELGVPMVCYRKHGGYTEIVAMYGTDRPSIFDHSGYSERVGKSEFRNALRRHARWIKNIEGSNR